MKAPGTNAGGGGISRLGLRFADRRARIPCPRLSVTSQVQNSNREGKRLEITVTQTKQSIRPDSNREKVACFSPPEFHQITGQRPRWDSRAGTPTSGVAGGLTPALPYEERPGQLRGGEKMNSRPPDFVAIRMEANRLFCSSYRAILISPCSD
jgi:hypothetical protein